MGYGATRYTQLICNRTNNCGGDKKAGLGPTTNVSTPFAMNAIRMRSGKKQPQEATTNAAGCAGKTPSFTNNRGGQCAGVQMRLAMRGC